MTGLTNITGRGGSLIAVHVGNVNGFFKDPSDATNKKNVRLIVQANKKKKPALRG